MNTPYKQKILKAATEGVLEGVKSIPGLVRGTVEPERVSTYAIHENIFSPNRSAKKRFGNIERRFRKEAAKEVKKSLTNLFTNDSSPSQKKTLNTSSTLKTPSSIASPTYTPFSKTPQYIRTYTTPFTQMKSTVLLNEKNPLESLEMKGGKQRRKGTRRIVKRSIKGRSKTLKRRYVPAKVLRF